MTTRAEPGTSLDFETGSREEALDHFRGSYDSGFRLLPGAGPFRMRHHRTDHGPWTSDRLYLSAGGFAAEPYDTVAVGRVTSGRAQLVAGDDTLSLQKGDLFVSADAGQPYTARSVAAVVADVRLPVAAFERVARESATASPRTRFALLGRRPVTAQAARRLAEVVHFAQRHVDEGDAPRDGTLRTAVGDLLAAAVLTTFPNTLVTDPAALRTRPDVPATVALALDFVHRNADLPVTPADIAAYASVSRRALELAFRDHLGTSPAAYLRRHRLARVHEELAAAQPGDGVSVTAVALRWGFSRSSRFAAAYRAAYGESPSRTLHDAP